MMDVSSYMMDVSSWRLALVQHRHLPARGLLSLFGLRRAFLLTGINGNQLFRRVAVPPFVLLGAG